MEKKKKSLLKKRKNFTIMFVPHDQSSLSKLKVPLWAVKILAICLLLVMGTVIYSVHTYINLAEEAQRLQNVDEINEVQAGKIDELLNRTQSMEKEMEELNELDKMVREMVGLDPREEESDQESNNISYSYNGELPGDRHVESNNVSLDRTGSFTVATDPGSIGSRSLLSRSGDSVVREDYYDGREVLSAVDDQLNNLQDSSKKELESLSELKGDVEDRLAYLAAKPDYWPVSGRITSDFGYRSNPFGGGGIEFHDGIDIAANHGTSIRAAGDGRVIFSGYRAGYGYLISINHGYGYVTHYAHCSSLLKNVGSAVKKGEVIARVGSTGRATGPHLHFEIDYNGRKVNPMGVLR